MCRRKAGKCHSPCCVTTARARLPTRAWSAPASAKRIANSTSETTPVLWLQKRTKARCVCGGKLFPPRRKRSPAPVSASSSIAAQPNHCTRPSAASAGHSSARHESRGVCRATVKGHDRVGTSQPCSSARQPSTAARISKTAGNFFFISAEFDAWVEPRHKQISCQVSQHNHD